MSMRPLPVARASAAPATRVQPLVSQVLPLLAALWLALVLGSSDAHAFAPDAPAPASESVVHAPAPVDYEVVLERAASAQEPQPRETWMERLGERLRNIPLRPVTIGDAPRMPDDPEPGAGVTIFLRF